MILPELSYNKMPKKHYVERNITLIGRTKDGPEGEKDSCEVCTEAHEYLDSVTKHDNRVTYKKIEVDSEEGEKLADEEDVQEIPYIKDCKTYEKGGKEKCRVIEGFNEDDWTDLEKLREEAEEAEEVQKEIDIEEPAEPEEPEISEPVQ